MPELRKDPVLGRSVIISTERAKRPSDYASSAAGTAEASSPERACPFCPGNEDQPPPEVLRRETDGSWQVRVVPNRFPALVREGELDRRGIGIYDRMNGIGAHEVIIETPDHSLSLADLDPDAIAGVLHAFRDRAVHLAKDHRIRYALVFKNHGSSAGASLSHSHSQLIATPVIPVLIKEELAGAKRYFDFRGRCIYCDMVKQELKDQDRIVYETERFVAFAPFAPRFPFETWIVSREHFSSYEDLTPERIPDLALTLNRVLARINRVLARPDYNFVIHTGPTQTPHIKHYHFHIEVMPKLSKIAGFEVGTGFYINPVPPENAARFLREDQ